MFVYIIVIVISFIIFSGEMNVDRVFISEHIYQERRKYIKCSRSF